jgi:hypothetical protein
MGKMYPSTVNSPVNPLAGYNVRVTKAALGKYHSAVLTDTNRVFICGFFKYGTLGLIEYPTEVFVPDNKITNIISGNEQLFLMTTSGDVYAIGDNVVGQLGDGTKRARVVPVLVSRASEGLQTIVCSGMTGSSFFVYPSGIKVWGVANVNGGYTVTPKRTLQKMNMNAFTNNAARLYSANRFTLVLTVDGQLFGTGTNTVGQLGTSNTEATYYPTAVYSNGALRGKKVTRVFTGTQIVLAIANDNQLYGWGNDIMCGAAMRASFAPIRLALKVTAKDVAFVANTYYILGVDSKIYSCVNGTIQSIYIAYAPTIQHLYQLQYGFYFITNESIVLLTGVYKDPTAAVVNIFGPEYPNATPGMLLDISKYSTSYTVNDVHHLMIWVVGSVPRLIVIFKNGETFYTEQSVITKKSFIVDTTATTTDCKTTLVTTNGTVYANSASDEYEFTMERDKVQKILTVTDALRGVTGIFASCTSQFVGDNCDIPICYGFNASDPLVCGGNGKCMSPNNCTCSSEYKGDECKERMCNLLYTGANCDAPTTALIVIIIVTCASVFAIAVAVMTTLTVCMLRYRKVVVKQNEAEISMQNMLEASMLLEDELEGLSRDWVIPFSDISFSERLAEGAFGVVMKGRYQNIDV